MRNAFIGLKLLGVMLCGLFYQSTAHALDGALDPTFDTDGRTTFNLSASNVDGGTSGIELSDGRLLIVGACNQIACLARLNVDGSFDTTYGPLQLGYARFDQFPGLPSQSLVEDVILLSDNRAVLAGCFSTNSDAIYVVRADGTGLDTSVGNGTGYFAGTQGPATFYDCAFRVRKQSDGKFVVMQQVTDSSYGKLMLISRVKADLSALDTTFGSNGVARVAFGLTGTTGNTDTPASIAIQSDGKIVIGGTGLTSDGHKVMEFARLTTSGVLDFSFGGNGDGRFHYSPSASINMRVRDLTIAPDQRIVFGGQLDDGSSFQQMVGRLTTSGTLDPSFSIGYITYGSAAGTTGSEYVARVVVTVDSIIALGSIPRTNGDSNDYFQVTRLDFSGNKVLTFGGGGSTYASFASGDTDDTPRVELVTTRGIVVAGNTINGNALQFGVARFQYDHIFESSFQ